MTDLDRLALGVLLPGFAGPVVTPEVAALLDGGLAGICLFGSNTSTGAGISSGRAAATRFTASVRAVAPVVVLAVDEEGGDVTRLHAHEGSPVLGAAALGVVDDVSLTEDTARAIGAELAAAGVTLVLGPVADVNSNADNPVIGARSFGADAELVARHVTAAVTGFGKAGVDACTKHFPGHGDTSQDSHLSLPRLAGSLDDLRARELVPFSAGIEAGVAAVMTSHLVVDAVDSTMPATLSAPVLRLLRDELGFSGVVVSDALDMAGASADRGIPAAAVAALAAGCDLLCLGADLEPSLVEAVRDAVVAAVKNGELDEARLVDASTRVRRLARPAPLPPTGTDHDPLRHLAGARAAVVVEGELPSLVGALVARIDTAPSIAVGAVPWGLPAELLVNPSDPASVGELVSAAAARPVVLQTRDAHRHDSVRALLDRLPADVVVVELGWPGPRTSTQPRICTFGASVPSRDATAELLRERGWTG
jgi:beta-N-acetylhexosaminidase